MPQNCGDGRRMKKDQKLIQAMTQITSILKLTLGVVVLLLILVIILSDPDNVIWISERTQKESKDLLSEGGEGLSDKNKGLLEADGVNLVVKNCTGCHSSKLIAQNRMNLEGWKSTIIWMQQTQNLWDLGEDEEAILAYLATNYAPNQKGRRTNLQDIEWYDLE